MNLLRWNFLARLLPISASLLWSAAAPGADLAVTDLLLRQFEGGRAWIPGYTPLAGETFAFDFRVSGFASVEGEFDAKLKLHFQAELVDAVGRPMAKPVAGASGVDITEEDRKKDWKPRFTGEFQLPVLLGKQEAVLRIVVDDQVADRKATVERRFMIGGPVIPADAPFGLSKFRFLRTEEDIDPLSVPAYRQGDVVWGRFEIVGFRTSGKGEIDVNYGIEVENSAGKRLFTQEVAAQEQKQFFYPPAYVPGVVSLQLQRNTPPGEYTVRIVMRDRLGEKAVSSDHAFRIE